DARMYRTGDLARYLPDGNIVFLGRNDEQIKIRGFRIEPAEIEAQLAAHPAVREAVVIARGHEHGEDEKRLVAYVTLKRPDQDGAGFRDTDAEPANGSGNDTQQSFRTANLPQLLRSYLQTRLPEHMVPAAFVMLDALPLTPNGKLDRKALPAPDDDAFAHVAYEPPRGAIEQAIADIWRSLLDVQRIGRHDHFFELGGHSILAVRMIARLHAATGTVLPLRAAFDAPTVADLALALQSARDGQPNDAPLELVVADRAKPLPVSFAEERVLAVQADAARAAMLNSSRVFALSGVIRPALLKQALAFVVRRHEILRTHYKLDEDTGRFVAIIDTPDAWQLTVKQASGHEGEAIRLAQAAAMQSPDCMTGPVFGAVLWMESPERAALVLSIHHIAMDAASWKTVWRDFALAYDALADADAPACKPLALQYRDFAAWERMHLDEDRLSALRQTWRERLAGAPVCVDLPFDRPRPASLSDRAGQTARTLARTLADAVKQTAAQHRVTPFIVLETTLALLTAQLSHGREVVIGTVADGRRHSAVEDMVGLFVNTIPLRHAIARDAPLSEHLARTAHELVGALEASELPFADIVSAVNPVRAASHDPVFQVFCQFQHGFGSTRTDLAGLRIDALARETVGRGAELAVMFHETDESVRLDVSYSADLFDAGTAEAIVELYLSLLAHVLRHPSTPIADVWRYATDDARTGAHGAAVARLLEPRAPVPGSWYAFSPAQQSVWLQEQAAPRGTSFFSVAAMRCPATADRARVKAAARALIDQHQSFWLEWTPAGLQREAAAPTTRFEEHRLADTAHGPDAMQAVLAWHRHQNENGDARTSSVAVFEGDEELIVALRSHHVQNDGWSAIRFFERFAKNYTALAKDSGHRFAMDRRFLDTLQAEDRYLASPAYERDAEYWRAACARMDGPPLVTQLADRPNAALAADRVESVRRIVDPALQTALAHAAASLSVSQAEYLTALTTLYLARVARTRDPVIGVSFLNRTKESLDIPGQFAKVIPLHVMLGGTDTPVRAIVHNARDAFRDALDHGRYPYGEMVRQYRLAPRHIDVSVNTLFLRHPVTIGGDAAPIQWLCGPENGLSFLFTQFGRTAPIELELRFNRGCFEYATVARHAERLLAFLATACAAPEHRADELPIVTEHERHLLLDAWNATDAEFPERSCLHQLFEAQAERAPDAIAVIDGERSCSYGELNARANQLAHHLIQCGVVPDARVAICLQRGLHMV
ncbi:condensation domain-containing protein, partial [Trinickia caryophylli]